jgi:hypothetical protein
MSNHIDPTPDPTTVRDRIPAPLARLVRQMAILLRAVIVAHAGLLPEVWLLRARLGVTHAVLWVVTGKRGVDL